MTKKGKKQTPSLLESESRGGDINEGGISFQASVTMAHMPRWLAMEGFSLMIREGIFDTEAQFYVPGKGFAKEAIESKDHSVTPAEFWEEIARFQTVDAGSPGSYQWFTLASTGLSDALHPIRNSLRRIREPYGFYQHDPVILDNSYQEYVQQVERLGKTKADADFLFHRVLIEDDWNRNNRHAMAIFQRAFYDNLSHYQELRVSVVDDIYAHLGTFIQGRRAQPITRLEIEDKIRERLPEQAHSPVTPVKLFTAIDATPPVGYPIYFSWERFFGGAERVYPPAEEWHTQLLTELRETKDWIQRHRAIRHIQLDGNRRLSTSVAIGFVFSAVSGFSIDMSNRGETWSTRAHPKAETPPYPVKISGSYETTRGERLVVTVGIFRDIVKDVEAGLGRHGLGAMPTLHLHGDEAVQSPYQLNLLVRELKDKISRALHQTGARRIDLFLAGPAPLGLFLGHRLNATASIQCYEQINSGQYISTCYLI